MRMLIMIFIIYIPDCASFDQNGTIAKWQSEGIELATQVVIGASINNAQVGYTRMKLTA